MAANQQLDDYGWVKGPDGVRAKDGQRLEFEYSTPTGRLWRSNGEMIIQNNLRDIGIKLDIQNYPGKTFFGSILPGGKASPPRGALVGRYDIAEFQNNWSYDPDDFLLLACDQLPPNGFNITFYCNQALDALYKQEQSTADAGERQQIFDQIHQIYLPGPVGAGETINIWEWWCDNGKC